MKRIIAITVLLSTLIGCCACQPTPDKSAVQSKTNGEYEKALSQQPQSIDFDVTESYTTEFEGKDKGVIISVNAPITVPDTKMVEVAEITAGSIDEGIIKSAVCASFGKKTAYEPDIEYTKSELQDIIKRYEYYMTDEYLSVYEDEALLENARKNFATRHDAYVKAYASAPDKHSLTESTLEFKPAGYYLAASDADLFIKEATEQKTKERILSGVPTDFQAVAYFDDGYIGVIRAQQPQEKSRRAFISFSKAKRMSAYDRTLPVPLGFFGNRSPIGDYYEEIVPCTIDENKAKALADNLVKDIGLADSLGLSKHSLEKTELGQEYHYFEYRRCANGLVSLAIDFGSTMSDTRERYGDELLSITVTDDGIMNWTYEYPLEIVRTVNKGVDILGFDDIIEIFKEQSAVTYDTVLFEDEDENKQESTLKQYADSANVQINNITFGLLRLAEKDKRLTYLISPAWVFSGEITYYDTDGSTILTNAVKMIINAVDGSIINASDCY